MKLEDYIKLLPNLFKRVKRLEKDGGDQEEVTWDSITEKPAVIASGTTQATARQSIGAGTSNLAIGTTASTAKAGNYKPSATEVVTALNAMTPEQVTTLQTKLGIVTEP